MLDFVLHPSSPDTSGIPVEDERLQKVTEWVSKQEDPIDGELLPDASQTAKELLAKGLFKVKFTAALLNGIEPEDCGGVGTPFESEGNGDCLLNSVATFFAKEGGRKANLACTAITRWMPRDDWWMCFGLPSNSKNRLQDLGATYSWIQRCSRTGAHNTPFDRLHVSTANVGPLVTLRCSWLPL
ncbi:hypothetical protein Esi_0406_0006 [Ectocarpus siliculosus]|uniref:Uncharacterized protein n=1 Tax=Ectocarpus siliculosus TaxID=2880 RepID=D7G0J6_ECTSI|nr:hypothetical protein Esi_0406_0006 [Ectocarpus siliculosus]|eukprot:CBJ33025.1 hypothetical protein Esi_0406_0006 [Ectocarpus siliculosus]